MASSRRSRVLGDEGDNHPEKWAWGGPNNREVHLLLLIYACDEGELGRQLAAWLPTRSSGVEEIETLTAGRQPEDNREHFGFMDGVGQPVVEGSGRKDRQERRTHHATVLPAGEFVLGLPNTYGVPAPSPTVAAAADPGGILPPSPAEPGRHNLGLNGTYLVFRHMDQDVAGFWTFVSRAAARLWPGDPAGPERLASKCVGRWPSGAPLVLHPGRDPHAGTTQTTAENDFAYGESDPHGFACPLGAHIRRANPRDALDPATEQKRAVAKASANRHRLLRRGRSFGPRLTDRATDDGARRGLYFICLIADLERQFEFVQQAWINNPAFSEVYGETDPLIGTARTQERALTIQTAPLRARVRGIPDFIRLRGGAYFFMPGIRALHFLATAPAGPR